jgi:hypothetical protein
MTLNVDVIHSSKTSHTDFTVLHPRRQKHSSVLYKMGLMKSKCFVLKEKKLVDTGIRLAKSPPNHLRHLAQKTACQVNRTTRR